jgi:hypothetical protein
MTQTTFAPPPVLAAPEEAPETGGSSRRPLVLVGGLVAALALAGGGYVLLSGGGSEDLGSGPVTLPPAAKPVAKPAVKAPTAAKPAVKVPPTSTVPLGRDPFHALYIPPVVTATTANAPTTPTTGTSTPTTGTSTPTTTTSGPTTTAPKLHKLVFTKFSGTGSNMTATFNVDGRLMVAKPGSVFGPTSELRLISIEQDPDGTWGASIQVGDSEPKTAYKGEPIWVQ